MGKVNQSNFGLIESWVVVKVDAAQIGNIRLFAESKFSNVVHEILVRNQLKIEPIKLLECLNPPFSRHTKTAQPMSKHKNKSYMTRIGRA